MGLVELILVAVGLAMDAFAVAICKGLGMRRFQMKSALIIALFFGAFQGLMPVIGWVLGSQLEQYITSFDHWIVFVLLAIIGGKMIKESFEHDDCCGCETFELKIKELLVLSLATSIDAMAAGISLAMDGANIWLNAACIGITTCVLSAIGVKVGNVFGSRFEKKAQISGGVILILLGLKILLEHLGYL